ncbi:PRC-barrel domain-containing protein [Chroococcidiopsis sp. CCNUC1]|uniref:PRC-barrel domain-containing protein n=1 Tax=Chroococcidiopsis sp. CCNUC1 TaxID=2653189 RepID=UPI002021D6E9|nr:PRC-barrel domain-containing protein [Chroococcidiopsis sp. CCNUC1]URD53678.1 PRC-barrel domain-containing protein [Chroococcidiopsis sp. CCNUC1]
MRKGSDVIGKVVVTYDTGKKIERIIDLIFDRKQNRLLGFLVEEKGLFRDAKAIPLQEVQAIGLDAIVVRSKESIIGAHRVPAIAEILRHNIVLRGTRILTTEGLDLGGLVDLFFDEHSGLVEGYEVSGGMFADAYSGRSFVPAPKALKIGCDVAFVPPETAQMMQEQVGGIRGAVRATGVRLQDSAEIANRRLQAAAHNANQQLQAVTDDTSSKLQNLNRDAVASLMNNLVDSGTQKVDIIGKHVKRDVLTPDGSVLLLQGEEVMLADVEAADRLGILHELDRATDDRWSANASRHLQIATESTSNRIQSSASNLLHSVNGLAASVVIEQAKGRRILQTVRANDGLIIAASGQIVTESVLARTQTYNKEAELLNAVGLSLTTAVRSNTSDTWLETKVQMRDRASIAQANLHTFWQTLQAKVKDLQGRSTQAIGKQRLEKALGRPVTRVILDAEDNVILNVGELITHRAMRQAESSGSLNILLNSVYTKEPEISGKELRASERGMAALEYQLH